MSDFTTWFAIGFQHIADWNGYDHMLFLLALCGVYQFKDWKRIVVLITAFTVGHSITLALSALRLVHINTALVEVLIPLSIVATALYHLLLYNNESPKTDLVQYTMALFFGFIHGLGFSVLLKSLLGENESIILPLFSFNIGLEVGQIMIVAVILCVAMFISKLGSSINAYKNRILLSGVTILALFLTIQRITTLLFE